MFFYFSLVNIYFRILVLSINTNYLWHWRIPLQGILNDLIAAGLFYLFFKILWVFLKSNSIRSYLLGVFIFFWILINYANYQYTVNFNSLLPLSWFVELRNIFKMVGVLDVTVSVFDMDLVYLIVIPLVFSIATIWIYWENFMSTDRLRSIVLCFILIVFFQSSTLYPDIHPRIASSVQSHLFKYCFFFNKDSLPV